MPSSLQSKRRPPLTPDEQAEAASAIALTERRLRARATRFTPFGLLVETDHVRLTLERQDPRGAKNIDTHPVARVDKSPIGNQRGAGGRIADRVA